MAMPPLPTDFERAFLNRKQNEQYAADWGDMRYEWTPEGPIALPDPPPRKPERPGTMESIASDLGTFATSPDVLTAPLLGMSKLALGITGMFGATEMPKPIEKTVPGAMESETGKMAAEVTPYIVSSIPAFWGAKAVAAATRLGPKAATTLMLSAGATADAATGSLVEDPNDPNSPARMVLTLADFAEDSRVAPILEWLAGDGDDGDLEKRLKRGAQEGMTNIVGEAMLLGGVAAKYLANLRTKIKSGEASEVVDQLRAFGQGWEQQADALTRENPELANEIWSDDVARIHPDLAARKGAVRLANAIEKVQDAAKNVGGDQSAGTPRLERSSEDATAEIISSPPDVRSVGSQDDVFSFHSAVKAPPSELFTSRNNSPSMMRGSNNVDMVNTSDKKVLQPTDDVNMLLDAAAHRKAPVKTYLEDVVRDVDGASVVAVRVKDGATAIGKIETKRRPASTFGDYLGGRIVVNDLASLDELQRKFGDRIIDVENFLDRPKAGYRAVHAQIVDNTGFSFELQMVPREIAEVQPDAHKIYVKWRRKTTYTPEELARQVADYAEMQEMFSGAWDRWERRVKSRSTKKNGKPVTPLKDAEGIEAVITKQFEGVKLNISERREVVTISRIEVPKESRDQGTGTRAMEQLVEWADANGKTLALSPSADFGGTKSRLVDFYKRFGFVENKGRSKDLEISETMIRTPKDGK